MGKDGTENQLIYTLTQLNDEPIMEISDMAYINALDFTKAKFTSEVVDNKAVVFKANKKVMSIEFKIDKCKKDFIELIMRSAGWKLSQTAWDEADE